MNVEAVTAAVLMAVYTRDEPDQLRAALHAITDSQSRKPDLLMLVIDGPIKETLESEIHNHKTKSSVPTNILRLQENVGLSLALQAGVDKLKNTFDYIIRTDADDISRCDRIREQLDYMIANPEVGLASSQVSIFEADPRLPVGNRNLPSDGSINAFAKTRTPINHSCAIFRSKCLIDVDYPSTRIPFEDWWISLRILKLGWKIGVIDRTHLHFRGGDEMIARRHGVKYLAQELEFFKNIYREELMPGSIVFRNIAVRVFLRLLPGRALAMLYKLQMHR